LTVREGLRRNENGQGNGSKNTSGNASPNGSGDREVEAKRIKMANGGEEEMTSGNGTLEVEKKEGDHITKEEHGSEEDTEMGLYDDLVVS
jgi:hypothetical protein